MRLYWGIPRISYQPFGIYFYPAAATTPRAAGGCGFSVHLGVRHADARIRGEQPAAPTQLSDTTPSSQWSSVTSQTPSLLRTRNPSPTRNPRGVAYHPIATSPHATFYTRSPFQSSALPPPAASSSPPAPTPPPSIVLCQSYYAASSEQ